MLRLDKCAGTQIGNSAVRGVSGGERKRTSVANELLVNPSVIMLDEPTSGLDSRTAYELIVTLQALAQSGRTVISSIHQPSSEVMHLFQSLMLMADGKVVYMGENTAAVNYFEKAGFPCPAWTNPADFYLTLLVSDGKDAPRNKLVTAWQENSERVAGSSEAVEVIVTDHDAVEAQYLFDGEESYATTYLEQLEVLFERSMRTRWETLVANEVIICKDMVMAIMVMMLWWQVGNTEPQIRNRGSLLFFLPIYWGFNPIFNSVVRAQTERPLLKKERQSGTFRLSAYYLSGTLASFICQGMWSSIFVTGTYFAAGLRPEPGAFLCHWSILMLSVCIATALGDFFGFAIENPGHAASTSAVVMLSIMLCTGFYVERESIPVFMRWLSNCGFTTFSWNALLITEFDGASLTYDCLPALQSNFAVCNSNSSASARQITSRMALDTFNVEGSRLENIGYLVLYLCIVMVSTYVAIRCNVTSTRVVRMPSSDEGKA